jgi:Sulfotransferase family
VTGNDHPPRVTFVGGTGRSGTHVVAKLLGKTRELEDIRQEVRFHVDPGGFGDLLAGRISLKRYVRRLRGFWWKRYRGGGRPPDILPWLPLGRRPRGLHKLVDPQVFELAVSRFEADFPERREGACRELFFNLLWPLADRKGAAGLVEMSCDSAVSAPALARVFPDAKFIHVVRDGRDASASRVRQGRHLLYPRTRAQGIRWWESRVRRIEAALAELPDSQWETVSLDLLVQPRAKRRGMKVMLDLIGVPKQPRLRRYFRRRVSPELGNVGRWRRDLSERKQERVRAEYERAIARMERDGLRSAPLLREVYEAERELAARGRAPATPRPGFEQA